TPSLRKGTVFENFVVTWNTFAAQSFKVHLKVTRRARAGMMRTDYSLINEEDDKLLVDEGYGEARRIGERRGWTLYTGVKTLKFASTLQNLLSPGVMAMFLDSTASTLTRFRPRPRNGSRRR